MRIKKGDQVIVISGNDKGVRGEVTRVIPNKKQVVISGVNIVKKHQKPQQAGRGRTQGGIIEFEAPIDASNVMVIDPESDEPTRVGIRRVPREDDPGKTRPVRFAKKSGVELD
ncbi:MAG: 50S ribosomal protein L24 [Ardenticatenaceae bacterium]|nr:50S ribosomal protein L24 [Ardenticatenaceae bacterium]